MLFGSCVLKVPVAAVKCRSRVDWHPWWEPWINPERHLINTWFTLYRHLSWHVLVVSQELTNFQSFHMNRSTLSWLSTNYWSGDWVSTEYWSGCLSSTEPDVDQGYLESIMSSWESESVKSSWFCRFMKPITTALYLIILKFSPMHFSFIF